MIGEGIFGGGKSGLDKLLLDLFGVAAGKDLEHLGLNIKAVLKAPEHIEADSLAAGKKAQISYLMMIIRGMSKEREEIAARQEEEIKMVEDMIKGGRAQSESINKKLNLADGVLSRIETIARSIGKKTTRAEMKLKFEFVINLINELRKP